MCASLADTQAKTVGLQLSLPYVGSSISWLYGGGVKRKAKTQKNKKQKAKKAKSKKATTRDSHDCVPLASTATTTTTTRRHYYYYY